MLPSQTCGIPEAVCCPSMYDIADHILQKVYIELRGCYPVDECTVPLLAYVTMGNGDDGIMDALTIAIDSAAPSPSSLSGKGLSQVLAPGMRATYVLRLRESGWPVVQTSTGEIIPPDPVYQNALARHAYSHGEKMYRTLNGLIARGEVFPVDLPQPGFVQVSPLRPLTPLGGVVGFVTAVTVDMPWGKG